MRLTRFHLRTLMLAVAALAILTWGLVTLQRTLERMPSRIPVYKSRAMHHGQMERVTVIAVREGSHTAGVDELARLNRAWSAYHTAMRRKYEFAAAYPWVPVLPDPADPVPLSDKKT